MNIMYDKKYIRVALNTINHTMNIMYEIKLMTDNSTWPGDVILTVQYLTTKKCFLSRPCIMLKIKNKYRK